ncbi:hypothetical protein ACFVKB_33870 [Rhodococcus sp. NPDC127530]
MAEMSEKTPELGEAPRVGARVRVRRLSETAATVRSSRTMPT